MELGRSEYSEKAQIAINNFLPRLGKRKTIDTITDGLSSRPKQISSMFLYDTTGSNLFSQITRLPEYYLTRIEMALLQQLAPKIIGLCGRGSDIVELGSGECRKISLLFDCASQSALHSLRYVPVDINPEEIKKSVGMLITKYRGIQVCGVVADYTQQFELIPRDRDRLICFLGSTIGNLTDDMRRGFLMKIAQSMAPGDRFLVGMDMVKAPYLLEKAYNDSANVTALFNKNILNVVNSLAATDFDLSRFEHVAFYNTEYSRIEMHLRALENMTVSSPRIGQRFTIKKGELIHTENSRKFRPEKTAEELHSAGFTIDSVVMDSNRWYSLYLLSKSGTV